MSDKPRYYTVNITVEDEDGNLIAVWRSTEPFDHPETATIAATSLVYMGPGSLDFDRMDEEEDA